MRKILVGRKLPKLRLERLILSGGVCNGWLLRVVTLTSIVRK